VRFSLVSSGGKHFCQVPKCSYHMEELLSKGFAAQHDVGSGMPDPQHMSLSLICFFHSCISSVTQLLL
jgi:hypothetical protein